MRKIAKNKKHTKCTFQGCTISFKKNLGYYYRGKYYCGKTHARKDKKENVK